MFPASRSFMANALTALVNGVVFVTWLLVPTLLLDHHGLPVVVGGVILAASPVATAVASAAAGRWVGRWGSGPTSVGGVGCSVIGLLLLALMAGVEAPVGPGAVTVALVAVGFGLGLFSVPNMAMVLGAMPADRQGTAGGLTLMMRTVGIVIGVNGAALGFGALESAGWDFVGAVQLTVVATAGLGLGTMALAVVASERV